MAYLLATGFIKNKIMVITLLIAVLVCMWLLFKSVDWFEKI